MDEIATAKHTYIEAGIHERSALSTYLGNRPSIVIGQDEVLPESVRKKDDHRDGCSKRCPKLHRKTGSILWRSVDRREMRRVLGGPLRGRRRALELYLTHWQMTARVNLARSSGQLLPRWEAMWVEGGREKGAAMRHANNFS